MPRLGSTVAFPFVPGAPKPPTTIVITVETANPNVIDRVRQLFSSTMPLDQDHEGDSWETYIEVRQVNLGRNNNDATHLWSAAYLPDDED